MRRPWVLLFLFCFFSACSQLVADKDFKRVDMNEFYQDSGSNRYFLPVLPRWANFSEAGSCQRSRSLTYLDFDALKKGQYLSYEQFLQLQYLFNLNRDERIQTTKVKALPPKEEEKIFFEALEKIQSSFFPFIKPKFHRLHLIWLDPALNDAKKLKELKKLLESEKMLAGQPVFISLCLAKVEMENFLEKNELNNARVRLIPMELFSIFNTEGARGSHYLLNINSLFDTKQELHLFLLGAPRPSEFEGKFEIHP